ncbi:MAG: cation:proton antiporter regulatory subunit [Mycobacteriales bacterium]
MELERSALPGIGLCHTFTTARGRRVGVISYYSGERDLVLYDADDPDSVVEEVQLSIEEAEGVADLLSVSRIVERLADLEQQTQVLVTRKIPIRAGSTYDGRLLGDTQTRTRTSASIVAVVRDGAVIASPRPDFRFEADDVVVVIGTAHGTSAAATLFTDG